MIRLLKQLMVSKYTHLCLGVLILYGVAFFATRASIEEKILHSLSKYCLTHYLMRDVRFSREIVEFLHERYRERLETLTRGLFDYRDKDQVQSFLLPHGFLYEVWQEGRQPSYLLSEIVGRGRYETEFPEKISFDYLILGRKWVKPFGEFQRGTQAKRFLSEGGGKIYIHRDRLDSLLRWYFESLWKTQPKKPESYYMEWKGQKDPLTFFLYQDLKGVCEDIFVKRLFSQKKEARDYFMEEGFNLFLPTLLSAGLVMRKDKDLPLHPEHKYLRAILSGLSLKPTYTLFYILSREQRPLSYKPSIQKMWEEVKTRLIFSSPETLHLERISQISRELLRKMESGNYVP